MKDEKMPILLIEDDEVDIMSVQRSLEDLHITNPLLITKNGIMALELLNVLKNDTILILLDLNMPQMGGVEFLKNLRKQNRWKRVPVIVLTTSREEQDKFETFSLGISGYIIKPVDYIKFVEVMKTINIYWTLSEIP